MYKLIRSFEDINKEFDRKSGPKRKVWVVRKGIITLRREGKPGAWTRVWARGYKGTEYLSVTPADKVKFNTRYVCANRFIALLGVTLQHHDGRTYAIPPGVPTYPRNDANRLRWPHAKDVMVYDLMEEGFVDAQFDPKLARVKDARSQWLSDWNKFNTALTAFDAFDALTIPDNIVYRNYSEPADPDRYLRFVEAVRACDVHQAIAAMLANYYSRPRLDLAYALREYYDKNRVEIQQAAGALVEVPR